MTRSDLDRCAVETGPVAAAAGLVAWGLLGPAWALCLVLSALWGAANLWLLTRALQAVTASEASPLRRLLWVALKMAWLLGGVAVLAVSPFFSAFAFILGLHAVFAVVAWAAVRAARAEALTAGGSGA